MPVRLTVSPRGLALGVILSLGLAATAAPARAVEPSPSTYWKVDDVRPGMKGTGRTVMTGTKLEEFGAEVLGVMKDVSPGRDMILCRLTGCNLEHAGIIQGMSGSPIYVDGKLLGAVAFAWEFAKDPIAGVTPFEQMVAYVRSSDRKASAEAKSGGVRNASAARTPSFLIADASDPLTPAADGTPSAVTASGGAMAGMRPISTPVAASGFSPRALAFLESRFKALGMAPAAGGAATRPVVEEHGNKPLVPGSPLSIAMVTGDFDLSGIGTVTHVEGDRVYGFGHPMMGLGSCEFPMMTGYIHTVYPRASVSMKMGSPLKVVGVIDADVSTGVAGRVGARPDLLPIVVKVKTGQFADTQTYSVQVVREPTLLPSLVSAVLSNAIDTEGSLPEELTARVKAVFRLKGHDPVVLDDTLSGPRYTGAMGPVAMFGPVASVANILTRNPYGRVRIEGIDCEIDVAPGRSLATLESLRLKSDRVEPGHTLEAVAVVKPYKGERKELPVRVAVPAGMPEGSYDLNVCDASSSLRRRLRNEPGLAEPRDVESLVAFLRLQTGSRRTALFAHVPLPERGVSVQGQPLPNLPAGARALFASGRQTQDPPVRADLVASQNTPWVLEGSLSLKFQVVKDAGLSGE